MILIAFSISVITGCTCPATKQINITPFPWNKRDDEIVTQVKKRCKEIYKNSPCAKEVIKIEEHGYHVVCGHTECEI